MLIMLGLFLVSKIIHLIHVISILKGDLAEYRNTEPALILNYPPENLADSTLVHDSGTTDLRDSCVLVIIQYCALIIVNSVAMLITRKNNHYLRLMPWLITFIQLCELPFAPVLPTWYIVLITVWLSCSLFFLTVLSLQTLFQAVPILLTMLICLPIRLYALLANSVESVPFGYLSVFILLGLLTAFTFTIDVVSDKKRALSRLTEVEKEKECFRATLSSFPEGVMIARVDKDGDENSNIEEKRGVLEIISSRTKVEVCFTNLQLKKYLGARQNDDPYKNLELRNIVPFTFQTKKVIEKQRNESRLRTDQTVEISAPERFSINDLLREGWTGRRFYKIKPVADKD